LSNQILTHEHKLAGLGETLLVSGKRVNTKPSLLHLIIPPTFPENVHVNSLMAVGTRPDGGRFDVKRSNDFQTSENIPDRNQDKSP